MAGARTRSIWAGIVAAPLALLLSPGVALAGRAHIRIGNTLAGRVLTDRAGYVLMMFPREENSLKLCIRIPSCVSDWPPVTTTGPPVAGPGVDMQPARNGALAQGKLLAVTYAGWPLHTYRFAYSAAELRHEHWHHAVRRTMGCARPGRRVHHLTHRSRRASQVPTPDAHTIRHRQGELALDGPGRLRRRVLVSADPHALVLSCLEKLLIERRHGGACVFRSCEAVGVWDADRVSLSYPRRFDGDCPVRLMDCDAKGGDCLPRRGELRCVCRRGDKHLGQVHDADSASVLPISPFGEQRARCTVMRIVAIKRSDQHVGVKDQFHRRSSSASS